MASTPKPAMRPNCLKASNSANTSTKKAAALVTAELSAPPKVPCSVSRMASTGSSLRRSSQ